MDFNLTDEQNILKDSVSKFVADNYELETRRGYLAEPHAFSADNWRQFAELGWLCVPFTEEQGGFGGTAVDLMVLMEELGRGLVVEPYVASVLMYGGALAAASGQQNLDRLSSVIDGSVQGALAYSERDSRYNLHDVQTTAVASGDAYELSGEKTVVYNGGAADQFIVSARTSGERADQQGISLFLVDANAPGLSKTEFLMMDGQRPANLTFDKVVVGGDALIGELDGGLDILNAVAQKTIVGLAAEGQGAMQVLQDSTIEYSKTRKQFGVTIGSFQALQHRMVDMFTACEQHRSLLYRTVCSLDENGANRDEADIAKNVHALKVMLGRAGKLIGGEAIQIHGGMGMTDELAVGHYVKRLMMINTCFGDADYHLARFSELPR